MPRPRERPPRIGRSPGNDVVVPDFSVSPDHAGLRYLRGPIDEGDISLVARDLTVELPDGRVLLDHVSLPVGERNLVAILGPSGAGKSTLLGALTGTRPATSGTVRYDNRDLYAHYAQLRHRIGLVPQENVLHGQLSARRALRYASGLRFPGGTSAAERRGRVEEVLDELGLRAHAQTRASALSGGQQKRVNVALELLTRPSLLFLDEPTSGLDPGSTKSVWEMMRALADDGRTVIVVTHEVAHLDLCDRVLMLVPLLDADGDVTAGGRVAYYGPAAEGLRFFGKSRWAAVFEAFGREPARDWAAEFAASGAYRTYVAAALAHRAPRHARRAPARIPAQTPVPAAPRGRPGQFLTLTSRHLAVIAADRIYLTYMALLPVVLGLTIRVLSNSQGLAGVMHANSNAQLVLLILALAASLNGASSSVQELIKERAIYHRERAAGLSPGAYLLSKLVVLGTISVVQAAVLVAIGLAARPRPPDGVILHAPIAGIPAALVEIWAATALLAIVSMALGLFISAAARTTETVFQLLVGLTLAQVVMSGGARQLTSLAGLNQLSYAFPSRWSYAANASTINLGAIGEGLMPDCWWTHTPHAWCQDIAILAGLGVTVTFFTWILLIRSRPGPKR